MAPEPVVRLVLTEPSQRAGRLVIVDEDGTRRAALLRLPMGEEHPAFSPDGRWLVFASAYHGDRPHLWIAPAVADATPIQLTAGSGRDIDPVWGDQAVVFASDRGPGGDFDLYQLAITWTADGPRAMGAPIALTDTPDHELAPSLANGRLAYQVIEASRRRSYIAERRADGGLVGLTDGPADGSPAWDRAGRRLAYVTTRVRPDGGRNLDVVVITPDDDLSDLGVRGLELEATDEGGPSWSTDGRWLFATSIARASDDAALMASVIYVDTAAAISRVRVLRDRVGIIPRLGAAVAPVDLDDDALGRNPDYTAVLAEALVRQERERAAALRSAR